MVPFNREATQRYGAGLVKNKIHNRNLKDFRAIYQSDPFSYSKSYSDAHFKALKVKVCVFFVQVCQMKTSENNPIKRTVNSN